MPPIRNNARILHYAFLSAIADWRAMYTWKTWTFGWLARILCQVAYFSLLGRFIGREHTVVYLVIGNSVFMVAQSVLLTISSTSWERMAGTYPLLIGAPGSLFTVFAGRSAQWVIDGAACSAVSLFLMGYLFGVTLPMPEALLTIPIMFVIAVAAYGFGLALGAVVLGMLELRILAANVSLFFLMLLTGAEVPVSFWPPPVRVIAELLPITHGLAAIRGLIGGASAGAIASQAIAEILVGAGWLGLAALIFVSTAARGRVTGTIEFGI